MSATVLPFYSRRGDTPVPGRCEVIDFPAPLGGPHVTRCLNAVLIAANALRSGHIADVECFSDFRLAVSDPSWDDADASAILDQVEVATRWLQQAAQGRTPTVFYNAVMDDLSAAMDILRARSGPGAPPFDASAGARALMDMGEIE